MPPRKRPTEADTPVEQPCTGCFPDGWPDGAGAVGCEHGSWTLTAQEG